MRIPFPERIAYPHAFLFAGVLATAQLVEGTIPVMVALVFCFIMVSVVAFNLCGGMVYPSGAFIGCNAFITLVVPMTAKALLGEAANANLLTPVRTLEVYFCGMLALFAGAVISRYFRPKQAYFSGRFRIEQLRSAYYGCVAFSILLTVITTVLPSGGNGSLSSILAQLNRFPAFAFLLGVIYTVRHSNGRRSLSWPLLAMMLYIASGGLYSFSKEAFLSPFLCWVIAVALMRYRLTWINILSFSFGLFVVVTYMVPYAQIGRTLADSGRSRDELIFYMVTHMEEVRQAYKEDTANVTFIHDYDRPITLLDRIDVLAIDDALIDLTDHQGRFGYEPLITSLQNFIPHFLWAGKPRVYFGNVYAHQLGMLGAEDNTTGISFSFASDAYHEGGFACLLFIVPLLAIVAFTVLDSVIGDVQVNPAGLVMTLVIVRIASEGMLPGIVSLLQQSFIATIFVIYVAIYALPAFGNFFIRMPAVSDNPALPVPVTPS